MRPTWRLVLIAMACAAVAGVLVALLAPKADAQSTAVARSDDRSVRIVPPR